MADRSTLTANEGSEKHAIVGIIDDEVAFLNQRFQNKLGGTRIQSLWNQNGCLSESKDGNVLRKAQIDEYIERCRTARVSYPVAEERLYYELNLPKLARATSHATHVLDIAAGENPAMVSDDDHRDIVAVALKQPQSRFSDTSGRWLIAQVVDSLTFLLIEANHTAQHTSKTQRSLVVNLSFGNLAGPHNGSSMLESAIDHLVANISAYPYLSQVSVFIAAGNQRQTQCTARTDLAKKIQQTATFRWKVLPDDMTPSFLECWFPERFNIAHLVGSIASPCGKTLDFQVGSGDNRWALNDKATGLPVGFVQVLRSEHNANGNRPMLLIAVSPTGVVHENVSPPVGHFGGETPRSSPGIWEIRLACARQDESIAVDAWIQRDDTLVGNPSTSRQSYFDDPNYKRTDALGYPIETDSDDENRYVSVYNTINSIATGREPSSVGAYRLKDSKEVFYSGRKRRAKSNSRLSGGGGKGAMPSVMGIGEDSVACPGVIAAGSRSGSSTVLGGTSMATAHATRVAAARVNSVIHSYGLLIPLFGEQETKKRRRLQQLRKSFKQ